MKKVDYKAKVISLLGEKELTLEDKRKLGEIFPQLKKEYECESNSNRIREMLISLVKDDSVIVNKREVLSWLEHADSAEGKWKLSNKDREQINQICLDLHDYAHYVRGKDSYEAKRLEKESEWLRSIKKKL